MAKIFKINKQMRESFKEICDLKEDISYARIDGDHKTLQTLKRQLTNRQRLLHRNSLTYWSLENDN